MTTTVATSTSLLASSDARLKRMSASSSSLRRGIGGASSSSRLGSSSSSSSSKLRARRRGAVTVARVGTSFKKNQGGGNDDDDETLTSRRALLAGKALFTVGGEDVCFNALRTHRLVPLTPHPPKNRRRGQKSEKKKTLRDDGLKKGAVPKRKTIYRAVPCRRGVLLPLGNRGCHSPQSPGRRRTHPLLTTLATKHPVHPN